MWKKRKLYKVLIKGDFSSTHALLGCYRVYKYDRAGEAVPWSVGLLMFASKMAAFQYGGGLRNRVVLEVTPLDEVHRPGNAMKLNPHRGMVRGIRQIAKTLSRQQKW